MKSVCYIWHLISFTYLFNIFDVNVGRPNVDQIRYRLEVFRQHIRDAQWRLRIATAKPFVSFSHHRPAQRHKRLRDSVTSDCHIPTENTVVPRMLSRSDSLLNICLTEGRLADAQEVVKV